MQKKSKPKAGDEGERKKKEGGRRHRLHATLISLVNERKMIKFLAFESVWIERVRHVGNHWNRITYTPCVALADFVRCCCFLNLSAFRTNFSISAFHALVQKFLHILVALPYLQHFVWLVLWPVSFVSCSLVGWFFLLSCFHLISFGSSLLLCCFSSSCYKGIF